MSRHLLLFAMLFMVASSVSCSKAKLGVRNLRSNTPSVPPIKKLSFPRIVSEPETKIGAGLSYQYQIEFENAPAFPFPSIS